MRRGSILAAAASILLATAASAQSYPDHPITMVVPFAAGGPTDTVARLIAEPMTASLGQQVIVENVGGAGGTLGAARVAKADPDGYTLLLHHIGQATSASLYRKLPYKPGEAFARIGLVTDVPMTIVARNRLPTRLGRRADRLHQGEQGPGHLANAGIGSASHLCGMLLMDALDTPLTTVPYKGTGPAMTDLMGGQVDLMCDQTTNTSGQIKGGKIKAYAVTTKAPVPSLPDLPTLDASGLPGFEVGIWHGLYAPAGTPPEVIEKLAGALQARPSRPQGDPALRRSRHRAGGQGPGHAGRARCAAPGRDRAWQPIIEAAGVYAD